MSGKVSNMKSGEVSGVTVNEEESTMSGRGTSVKQAGTSRVRSSRKRMVGEETRTSRFKIKCKLQVRTDLNPAIVCITPSLTLPASFRHSLSAL